MGWQKITENCLKMVGKRVCSFCRAWPALKLLLAVLFLAQAFGLARAADTDAFSEQIIQSDERILSADAIQFDGIAGHELILFLAGDSGRKLEIVRQTIATTYDLNALSVVDLPEDVFAFQLVDFDSDGREEALLVGLEHCYLLDYDNGGFQPQLQTLASYDRLYSIPNPSAVNEHKVAFDLNGDGKYELVLPSWEGARIYRSNQGKFQLAATLKSISKSTDSRSVNLLVGSGSPGMLINLPEVAVHDVNTDQIADVLLSDRGNLQIWFQTGDLQFSSAASQTLELRQEFTRNLRFVTSELGDINNDKLIDYCRAITQGDGDQFRTIVEVYLGNIASGFSQRPSRRLVLNDYAVGLALCDLNGDGAQSIVVATVPVSTTSMVKAFLVQRMSVELSVYHSVNGVIAEQPASVKKISCGIDLFGTRMPARFIGCMKGDLDGDKLSDLAIINDDDELQVFKGEKDPEFSDKAIAVREAAGVRSIEARDLNGDGKDDLIMLGYDENGRDVVHLLWSNE